MQQTELPFIDLHRHLSGSIRPQTVLELGRQHNISLPANELPRLIPHVQVVEVLPDLISFLAKIKFASTVIADYDACRRIAYEAVEDAANEGIDYLELRFSAQFLANPFGLSQVGAAEAVIDGAQSAASNFGIRINLIGVLSRTLGPEACMEATNALLEVKEKIVALDLAGDEKNWPGHLFVDHFHKGRSAGWQITVHAGEAAGADNVRQAIEELGATRIGHATNAIEDRALMDEMAERGIGIESNLTSNVQTSTVADLPSHPLRKFLERGLLATINTDDPQTSDIDLPFEYNEAAPQAGLTPKQIIQAQQNALTIAYLSEEEKGALVKQKQISNQIGNEH
ncbi:MAG: adenosine deaminase [Chloroflexota bacterium]